jgi:glycosyltransferase involved in cell wall biosynthesis
MASRISVCIPTCDRPDYLENAIQSVLQQSLSPYEVVVGNDSAGEETAQLVNRYIERGAPVRYLRNEPSLGQAKNVDRLFQEAEGDFILLLHDDDRLLEGSLEILLSCFEDRSEIVAAFGKQQVISAEGEVKWETTEGVNESYYRTSEYEGRQSSALRSAIVQQFPNNGYMVRAELAKEVGYDRPEAGDACDFAFGVALARGTERDFYYTNTVTTQYRHSEESIVRGDSVADTAYRAFKIVLEELPREVREDPWIQDWLRRRAPVAVMMAAQNGYVRDGFRWFFGPYHRHRVLSLGGVRRLSALLASSISMARGSR